MSKCFRVLKSGNSVSKSELLGKSIGIIISHAVDSVFFTYVKKLKCKIYLSDISLTLSDISYS